MTVTATRFVRRMARVQQQQSAKRQDIEGCAFADVPKVKPNGAIESSECAQWNRAVANNPAADPTSALMVGSSIDRQVLIGGKLAGFDASSAELGAGLARAWQPLVDRGVPVVALGRTPWPGIDVPECVAANPDSLIRCAIDRDAAKQLSGSSLSDAVALTPRAQLVDPFDAVCPTNSCAPVIGGTLVYRDTNHLTARYSQSLAARLEPAIVGGMKRPENDRR